MSCISTSRLNSPRQIEREPTEADQPNPCATRRPGGPGSVYVLKIVELVGEHPTVCGPGFFGRPGLVELRKGGDVAATLRHKLVSLGAATGTSADGAWEFESHGIWHTTVAVRRAGSHSEVSVFKYDSGLCRCCTVRWQRLQERDGSGPGSLGIVDRRAGSQCGRRTGRGSVRPSVEARIRSTQRDHDRRRASLSADQPKLRRENMHVRTNQRSAGRTVEPRSARTHSGWHHAARAADPGSRIGTVPSAWHGREGHRAASGRTRRSGPRSG